MKIKKIFSIKYGSGYWAGSMFYFKSKLFPYIIIIPDHFERESTTLSDGDRIIE